MLVSRVLSARNTCSSVFASPSTHEHASTAVLTALLAAVLSVSIIDWSTMAHIYAEGIQQTRLQEKCQAHTAVSSCLEGTVSKLGMELKDGPFILTFECLNYLSFGMNRMNQNCKLKPSPPAGSDACLHIPYGGYNSRDKQPAGCKLQEEIAAWLKDESQARQELTASVRSLTGRLQLLDTSLAKAEENVSDLQKIRHVLECKLSELERAKLASAATHAAEVDKLEHKVQDALAAKDDLYRDFVAMQQAKSELKEELVQLPIPRSLQRLCGCACVTHPLAQGLERAAVGSLKNDLTSVKAERNKEQDQLQQLEDEHTKLKASHEVICTRVNELEETCSALQVEKSDLTTTLLEVESENSKAKQENEERITAISEELKQSEEGRVALQANLEEVTTVHHPVVCGFRLHCIPQKFNAS